MAKSVDNKKYDLRGFSKLSRKERLEKLHKLGLINSEDLLALKEGIALPFELAENFIENVIGYFQIPLGVATNFNIDGVDYVIPMAVEETSIIAAASSTAKWVKNEGHIETKMLGHFIIGQIQIGHVKDIDRLKHKISKYQNQLVDYANNTAQGLVRRGGGVKEIVVREVARSDTQGGESMAVLHVHADPRDAMGANIINQVCEALKPKIESLTGEKVTMCILSNLVDTKLTQARVVIKNVDPEAGKGIEEASLFALQDPYRAATNNKGVLNGIDAVVLATGNDWRAVEAGVHAYAARDGRYRSITTWKMTGKDLVGELVAPIVVGTVGGVTKLHPTAQLCLKMLNVTGAEHLSRVIAAVGLVQNLGALKALSTVGIVEGHMKLHAANLALAAGANKEEIPWVKKELEDILKLQKRITLSQAVHVLQEFRKGHPCVGTLNK